MLLIIGNILSLFVSIIILKNLHSIRFNKEYISWRNLYFFSGVILFFNFIISLIETNQHNSIYFYYFMPLLLVITPILLFLILASAPAANFLVYGTVCFIVKLFCSPLKFRKDVIITICIIACVAFSYAAPVFINSYTNIEKNISWNGSLNGIHSLAILVDGQDGRCDKTCRQLLFNKKVNEVIIGDNYKVTLEPTQAVIPMLEPTQAAYKNEVHYKEVISSNNYKATLEPTQAVYKYTIETKTPCSPPASSSYTEDEKILFDAGECLVRKKDILGKPDAIIIRNGTSYIGNSEDLYNQGWKISLYLKENDALIEKTRFITDAWRLKIFQPLIFFPFIDFHPNLWGKMEKSLDHPKTTGMDRIFIYENPYELDYTAGIDLVYNFDLAPVSSLNILNKQHSQLITFLENKTMPFDSNEGKNAEKYILNSLTTLSDRKRKQNVELFTKELADYVLDPRPPFPPIAGHISTFVKTKAWPMLGSAIIKKYFMLTTPSQSKRIEVHEGSPLLGRVIESIKQAPNCAFFSSFPIFSQLLHSRPRIKSDVYVFPRIADGGIAALSFLIPFIQIGAPDRPVSAQVIENAKIGLEGIKRLGADGKNALPDLMSIILTAERIARFNHNSRNPNGLGPAPYIASNYIQINEEALDALISIGEMKSAYSIYPIDDQEPDEFSKKRAEEITSYVLRHSNYPKIMKSCTSDFQ